MAEADTFSILKLSSFRYLVRNHQGRYISQHLYIFNKQPVTFSVVISIKAKSTRYDLPLVVIMLGWLSKSSSFLCILGFTKKSLSVSTMLESEMSFRLRLEEVDIASSINVGFIVWKRGFIFFQHPREKEESIPIPIFHEPRLSL